MLKEVKRKIEEFKEDTGLQPNILVCSPQLASKLKAELGLPLYQPLVFDNIKAVYNQPRYMNDFKLGYVDDIFIEV